MNLYGQIIPGIDEFNEQGEFFESAAMSAKDLKAFLFNVLRKSFACIGTVRYCGRSVRMAG